MPLLFWALFFFHQVGTAGRTVCPSKVQRCRAEEISALGYIFQDDSLQQGDPLTQEDFVNRHGGVFRADGLTFVADQANAMGGEDLRGFLGYGNGSSDQDPVSAYAQIPPAYPQNKSVCVCYRFHLRAIRSVSASLPLP